MLRVVVISDTHLQHEGLELPDGDVLIHAGDFTSLGSSQEVSQFLGWLHRQPHPVKVFIAGNHDFYAEREARRFLQLVPPSIHYLRDSYFEVCGLGIWGSPFTPPFFEWAFMAEPERIKKSWDKIPVDLDILITHGPPHGILDQTIQGENVGCPLLLEAVRKKKPRHHFFGHIHEGRGQHFENGTLFVNASSLNHRYQGPHEPFVLDIEPGVPSTGPRAARGTI